MDPRGHMSLAHRVSDVWERVIAACRRAGRPKDNVEVVAVTKTVSVEVARAVCDEGIRDLGESRPQELWRKAEAIDRDVRWHLVGHLQRNKMAQTLPLVHLIHSVDSLRLL